MKKSTLNLPFVSFSTLPKITASIFLDFKLSKSICVPRAGILVMLKLPEFLRSLPIMSAKLLSKPEKLATAIGIVSAPC